MSDADTYTPEPGVAGAPSVSDCQTCGAPLPLEGEVGFHPMRKYCDEHQPKKKKVKADTPPRTVNVNIKAPTARATKKDSDAAMVEAGAARMLGLLPLAFLMAGDNECAATMQSAVPQIAAQLGSLSEFHPGLKKVFAPTESTGEAMAWMGLVIAVAPVVIGVLVHHNLVSPKLATMLAGVVAMGGTVPTDAAAA